VPTARALQGNANLSFGATGLILESLRDKKHLFFLTFFDQMLK
jgi:hypothetical protein